jgi:hypothetical protein
MNYTLELTKEACTCPSQPIDKSKITKHNVLCAYYKNVEGLGECMDANECSGYSTSCPICGGSNMFGTNINGPYGMWLIDCYWLPGGEVRCEESGA